MGVTGSGRKLTLDGTTFGLIGDADINTKFGDFESELVPTSGKPQKKMTKRAQMADSVDVDISDPTLKEILIALNDRVDSFTLSYKDGGSVVHTSFGGISIDDTSMQDGKATIKLLPVQKWDIFAP